MKKIIIIILLIGNFFQVHAQKPVIDTSVYGKWPGIGNISLSNDGAYACYIINNQPQKNSTLIVKSLGNGWEKEFIDYSQTFHFSPDSRQLYLSKGDSLCVLTLSSDSMTFIGHITWEIREEDKIAWLICQTTTTAKQITTIRNLATGEEQSFNDVVNYAFNPKGISLLLQKDLSHEQTELKWVDFPASGEIPIWRGPKPGDFTFNANGTGIFFTSQDSSQAATKQLWIYKRGEPGAVQLNLNEQGTPLAIHDLSNFKFDHTGNLLFFTMNKSVVKQESNPLLASVDVYSYKDAKLQSQQLLENQQTNFEYVYNVSNKRTIRLEGDNEEIKSALEGEWVLIRRYHGGDVQDEWNWNKKALIDIYLVSTIDGSRRRLAADIPVAVADTYQISPAGKYVIFYNPLLKDFLSYKIKTGTVREITKNLKVSWTDGEQDDWPAFWDLTSFVPHWTTGDSSVWLNSRYDLYQADPEGRKQPINLTNGYGAKHNITFNTCGFSQDKTIDPTKPVLLHFTNQDTKAEGFCKIKKGQQKEPEILSVLPRQITYEYIGAVVKAKNAEVYAVTMQDEKSPRNHFITKDFKTFKPITAIQPQKNYNWLISELVNWRTPDGKTTQGILYKPENFDPKKKYPVIFHYYEDMSGDLHHFYNPEYEDANTIDIPTYVSNGYLVFLPDIHFKVGYPGRSALNAILSAAAYLSKFSWVDTHKMGLMGHSFGGFETDYIITHSHLFAAAVSMSGMTDFVSAYGSLLLDGTSRQRAYELYRDRIGATLWQRPDLYIENSPVFKINEVTTPVLLMANKKDDDVPYEQGFEFFTGLRRMGKKAWMLQYDHGNHMAGGDIENKDNSIRIRQFFDYYLKGATPPKWMTEGIPATQKQIDSGFEPDTTGKRP